jgi:hypothetical protein
VDIEQGKEAMKKIVIPSVLLLAVGLMLQACGSTSTPLPPTPTAAPLLPATATNTTVPEPTPTNIPLPTPTNPPLVDMLTWLMAHPFTAAPVEFHEAVFTNQIEPPIDVGDLPEGFIATESLGGIAYLPDGEIYNAITEYLLPSDTEVLPENSLKVTIIAYMNEDVRDIHFEALARNHLAYMRSVGEYDVLFFYDESTVDHVWISGPYMIVVGSAPPADGSPNAWLSIFSEFLLDLYPPDTN